VICKSESGLAMAFRIPLWGQFADETPPEWLVQLMQSGTITLNNLGGLTYQGRSCLPGDLVVLDETGRIDFCTASEFDNHYTLLDDRHAA